MAITSHQLAKLLLEYDDMPLIFEENVSSINNNFEPINEVYLCPTSQLNEIEQDDPAKNMPPVKEVAECYDCPEEFDERDYEQLNRLIPDPDSDEYGEK